MKIKRQKKGFFAVTAASSDLAFLLIIYFLVVAGFNTNFGLMLNLPAKNSARLVFRDDLLRFDMDREGLIYCEGIKLDLAQTEAEISAAAAGNPDLAVLLSIDPGASWQYVVSFVEVARKLNIEAFSFSMKEET